MWYLSTDPEQAALFLCDQDVLGEVEAVSTFLKTATSKRWAADYYNHLLSRLDNLPKPLKAYVTTGISEIISGNEIPTSSIVGAHRVNYVQNRHGYAEWSKTSCPGWFFAVANSLLSKRELEEFLSRIVPVGLSYPDDKRGREPERKDLRNGPMGEISGDDGSKFLLW